MIKYFCDWCLSEISERNKVNGGSVNIGVDRLSIEDKKRGHTLKAEIIHTFDGASNSGQICKYCLIDLFNKLDDRPKEG